MERTHLFLNPHNLSYFIFKNSKGEFSNHGSHHLFTDTFNHDDSSFTVDISKPLVFDDLPTDEVETPQAIEELQPKMMVISIPHCLEVSSTSNHKYVETPHAHHHSLVCIEDQYHPQI